LSRICSACVTSDHPWAKDIAANNAIAPPVALDMALNIAMLQRAAYLLRRPRR
jgi:hypothetical protein